MSNYGNYNKTLESKFDTHQMIKALEYKLSKTDDPKFKNAIKLKLKSLRDNKIVNK